MDVLCARFAQIAQCRMALLEARLAKQMMERWCVVSCTVSGVYLESKRVSREHLHLSSLWDNKSFAARFEARHADLVTQREITQIEAKNLAMVDWFDRTVGELHTVIQGKGVDDDTLYIYVSDNG